MSFDMCKLFTRGAAVVTALLLTLAAGCDQPATVDGPPGGTPAVAVVKVRFELVGDGRVDYAAVADAAGLRQVPSNGTWVLTGPVAAVLTVRAEPGKTARCRIYVDDVVQPEEVAVDGSSATCIQSFSGNPPAPDTPLRRSVAFQTSGEGIVDLIAVATVEGGVQRISTSGTPPWARPSSSRC